MQENNTRGKIFRCPICKAEITVLAWQTGDEFRPRCCNVGMEVTDYRAVFYLCEVCEAEVAVVSGSCGDFIPHCCRQPMVEEQKIGA